MKRNSLLMCVLGMGISAFAISANLPEAAGENVKKTEIKEAGLVASVLPEDKLAAELAEAELGIEQLYNSIQFKEAKRPSFDLFRKSVLGYLKLEAEGALKNKQILSIIDFSIPSRQKRLWIIDLARKELLFHELVAHGKNSGGDMPTSFSNVPNSNQSSIGFYVTSNTYYGKHGLSLRLQGKEKGYNDNAMRRAIVMHGANYVNEGIVKSLGRLGRSFGCPSVRQEVYKPIINKVKEGSCLFIYYPDTAYLQKSNYLADEESSLQLFLKSSLRA